MSNTNNEHITIVRTADEIIDLLDDIQNDAFLSEGCSCSLHYDTQDRQFWLDWLTGKREL